MTIPRLSPAGKIALFYCIAAVGWIIGSDRVAGTLFGTDIERLSEVQTLKGLVFVALMTAALYLLVGRLHRVEERNRQVEEMLRVSERLETIGSLAATLVHDLNNVLAVIRGFTELAQIEQGTEGSVRRERLGDIENAVLRANSMVRQLSLFLQHAPGEIRVEDVGDVVRQMEPLLRQAASRRVDFQVEVQDPLPRVVIDRGRFEQALLNLVVNARDAMEGRPRRELRITVSSCRLRRHTSRQHPQPVSGEFVCIRVADTGVGIPPGHELRIFEPFFTTKPPGQGTGLGLPSVLRMAQQQGGWVEVESRPNEGARFDLYLPAAPPAAAVIQ